LARSIEAFVKNTDSAESKFDFTQEERRVIGDIFRFGMKLEDAARFEERIEKQESEEKAEAEALYPFLEDHDDAQANFSSGSADSSPTRAGSSSRSLICMSRQSSIFNYMVPSMFNDDDEEEKAISRAATSFITSSVDFRSLDFLALVDEDEQDFNDPLSTQDSDLKSVGGLVGDALLELQRSPKTDCPWKTMFSLARLLLQDDKKSTSTNEVFIQAAETAKSRDFESAVSDVYEGDDMERLARFMVVEMARCGHQVDAFEASLIVDLVLLLLQRLADFPLPSENHLTVTAGLVVVVLVAGHVSDRTSNLLSSINQECFVYKGYKRATSDLQASV
jgi:hypothetical protein